MRAFLLAVATAFVISGAASLVLSGVQQGSDQAFTTSSARIDPSMGPGATAEHVR